MAEKALWTTVMNSVIKEHGESQRRKWKVANENEALCSICEETGGILIRCAHEKCSAHFHLDCALNQGGISLMDNGLLICECDVHYKEIIFCSCKQKYDSNKAMIFCDECCDWYHLTCEHISSASQHLDRYTCRSCQDLLNHGKSVSKTLKEKNLEKEFRSTCNQNALRIIGHINELAVVVCPVIDSISQSLRDDEEPIDISELNNTIEYLSTPPYSPETKEGAENSETLEDDCNFLRLYGVHDLVRHWLDKCRDGKASWGKWLKNVEKLTNSLRDEFPMNFNHENITIAQQKFEEFKTIELQKPISISGFDGLVVLGDILKWILEFLQALHNVSQADFWTQHLSTLIRSVQGKVKKALSLTKEESFFVEFAKWFQFYAKSASEIVNRVGNWSNSVHRILRQEVECSLADAQKLLQSADEFPVRLTLIDTLKTSILQGTDLDGRIEIALQQSEIDDSEIEKLNDEKSNLCLTLPTDDLFNELNRKLIFLKAHQLASSEGRLSLSIAQSLVEEAKTVSITTSSHTVIPLLLQSLETQVHKIIENLENLIQSTTQQLGTFQIDLANSETIDSDLAKLETLPLITTEEEVLMFLKSLDSTFKRAHAILDNQTKVSPEDLESVVTDLSLAHSNQILDKFSLGQERKAAIRKIWNGILDLQGTAERNWAHLQGAIEDLKNGISISNETFMSFLQAARVSVVTKPEVECKAQELLSNAADCEKKCSHVLNSIQVIDEHSFAEVTNLLDLVKHFPLDGTLSTKIRRKQEILKTVLAAKNHLAEQQNNQNNAVIDEKQLISLREVKNNLLKLESLSALEIDAFDQQAIDEVKLRFLSLQWKLEIHFTLDEKNPTSSISLSQAEKLKQFGEKLNAPVTCSDEWIRLNDEMGKSLQVQERIRNIHSGLIQAVESFTPPSLDMMGISSLPELSPIQLQITALQFELRSWLQLISSTLTELSEVSSLIITLKITNDEDVHQYQELNYIIDIFNSANHLFALFTGNHSSSLIELKEIIGIMNKLGSTLVTLPAPFATFDLIQKIHQLLKFLYNECTVWMERFQYLLPQKVTRLKNKGDLKLPSPADLVTALALPIAQLIKTPLHERFFSVMTEGHAFRNSLLDILLDTNVDKTSGEVMDVVTEAAPGEKTVDEIITNKINQLNELKAQSEIIPMDMPESIVLQWAIDTLIWLKNIPHPHDSIEDASLPVDQARKRLQEASSLIRELHPRLVMALADIGLMNLDESKGPIGFHPNTFLYLKNAADYYEFLEQEIEKCSEFEESLQDALDKDEHEISAKLYLDQYNRLIIQPDVGIKKSLEKMLQTTAKAHEIENLKKFSSTVITKSGRASKKRFADDFIFDDSFEALQSGRSEGSLPSPKSFTELDLTQKDIRKKKTRPKCPGCGRELKSTNVSSYCTSRCAFKCASELVKALVAVRPSLLSAEESYFNEEHDLKNDLEALQLAKPADQDEGTSEGGDGKQHKNVDLNALLKRLPAVAKSFLLLEKEEGKRNQQSQQNIDIDQGLRLKARALLEDILISALSKQKIAGGVVQGAIIASELEDSIYNKYFKSGNFDRKDYRKHSQMLMHNLRQAHNETLIVRITRNEVTIDQLLGMSAQQLADSSLQEMRQKQYSAAVEDVQRVSTEEELEAKRRAVMAGQSESWRDRGSTTEEVIAKEAKPRQVPLKEIGRVASTDSTNSEIEELDAQNTGNSGASTNIEVSTSREEENVTSMDGATVRSLQIEQKVLASQNSKSVKTNEPSRPTKRPLDADAMTRLTTGQRPQKLAKTGENTEDVTSLSTDDKTLDSPKIMKTPSLESPRLKAPSLLEILKSQNFSKSQDAEDQVRQNSASTVSVPLSAPERAPIVEARKEPPAASNKASSSNRSEAKSSGSKYFDPSASYIPQMRLLNKEGNDTITISRVKDINIRTTMMTNDKRVQGSLKNAVNIDGRTKIPELQRFITEVLDQRKKIVASVVFLAFDVVLDDKNNGYNRFCEEFTRDQRASISNVSETVQLYVIPPQLKDSIAILKPVSIESYGTPSNQGILYGLIVAKEPGPSHFVNKPHPILPFALNSFSTLPTSNRVASSSTATQPQASPRPGSLISGGKPDGGSHFFPAASAAPVMARTTAFDSLNTANKPLTAAPRPILTQTTISTSSATPIEVQSLPIDRDKIRQVADFCAKKGVAKLKSLQENPESRTLMPFLFEGNPGYEEFMTTLKSLVGLASSSAPPVQQHLPPSPITSSNQGTFSAQGGVSLYNQSRMMGQQPAAYPSNNNLHPSSQNRRNSRFN